MEAKQSTNARGNPLDNIASDPDIPSDPYTLAYKMLTLGFHVAPSGGGSTGKEPIAGWKIYQPKNNPPTEAQLERWEQELHPKVWGAVTGIDFLDIEVDTPEWANFMLASGLKPHLQSPHGGGHFLCTKPPWTVKTNAPIPGLTRGIDIRGDRGFMNFAGIVDGHPYRLIRWPTPENLIPFNSLPAIIQKALAPESATQPQPDKDKAGTFPSLTAEDCHKCIEMLRTLPCVKYCDDNRAMLSESLWKDVVIDQNITFGPEGDNEAHRLSTGYVGKDNRGYSEQDTAKKIKYAREARETKHLGPTLCATIRTAGFDCPATCIAQTEKLEVHTPATLAIKLALAHERLPLNDVGNAKRLFRLFGNRIRFVLDMDKWIVWTGKFWQFDHGEQLGRMAKRVVSSIYAEAANADEDMANKLGAWARQSGFDARIKGMINQAKTLDGITVLPDELDSNPWLLNVKNGTVNLITGELLPHSPDDLITRIISIDYKCDAESQLWEDTLRQICSNDDDLILFMQRGLGCSATGSNKDMAFFLPQGAGFNGKSTLLGVIHDVLGPYAHEADPRVFMVSRNDRTGPNEDIADLYRKRFVLSAEINTQMRLSVSLVKRMTGGEQLRYERKYEHGFNFKPDFKLWLMSNHEPTIADSTNSIWCRVKKIPFRHFFGPEERNPSLRQQLVTEHGEAILAWLVHGAMEWYEFGLSEPMVVKTATEEYRRSQDVLQEFLAEKCNIEENATVLGHDLYRCYQNWCAATGEKDVLGKINFGKLLREKGFCTFAGTGNAQFWKGIELSEGVIN